ncbi:hypothetical protein CWB66_17880 [Pseudoalteromonas sp. S558]|nr:hypothetical protein CWB66_17880 [Pseudoalteromonas sp. S558]
MIFKMILQCAIILICLLGIHYYARREIILKKTDENLATNIVQIAFVFSVLLTSLTVTIVWAITESASVSLFIVLFVVFWSNIHGLLKIWRDKRCD